jgi:hypothetical protein
LTEGPACESIPAGGNFTNIAPGDNTYEFRYVLPRFTRKERKLHEKEVQQKLLLNVHGEILYGTGFGKHDMALFCFSYYLQGGWEPCSITAPPPGNAQKGFVP